MDSAAGHIEIAEITEDPKAYISGFEPIDAVDGEMFSWDEMGNLYHFSTTDTPTKVNPAKPFQSIYVGNWNYDIGEPSLVKAADGQQKELKEALIQHLAKTKHAKENENTQLSLDELIEKVSKTIK